MKREIKFRAWDKIKNRMWVGNEPFRGHAEENIAIQFGGEIVVESHENYYPSIEYCDFSSSDDRYSNTLVVMQYTGLLDKNGKEIYEGDIVRCDKNEWYRIDLSIGGDISDKPEHQEEVKWDFGQFDMRKSDYPIYWEIIGNIYENPELLK